MPGATPITPGAPPAPAQRKEKYSQLAEFTLALTQAMLRTGYYSSDHPEAEKSLDGLYSQFRDLVGDRSELSYLLALDREGKREVIIEGYDPVPLSLHQVMIKGMADLFGPKLLGFFGRWGLVSFSLRADCTPEEFNAFIGLMSTPPSDAYGSRNASERLKAAFVEQGIMHISVVFKDDIIGKERRLSWRVEMAISRLRKDLSMLPLYRKASPDYIQKVKLQIIDDVVRPMRTPALLKEFLVNYDLVAADIVVLEETQVERELVSNLDEKMLLTIGRSIVDDLKQLKENEGSPAPSEDASGEIHRRVHVLREITNRLSAMGTRVERDFLETLLHQNAISYRDLPEDVREALQNQRLADGFVERQDMLLDAMRRLPVGDAGRELCALVARVTPVLLRQRQYETVSRIRATVLDVARRPGSPGLVRKLAGRIDSVLRQDRSVEQLVEDLQEPEKSRRDYVVDLLGAVGQPAARGVIGVYIANEEKGIRISAFEALNLMGPAVLRDFVSKLNQIEQEWSVIRHILRGLAAHGDPSLAGPVSQFVYHANPHVRHAALSALCSLQGEGAEEVFIRALRDDEAEVRQTAVACLREIGSAHPDTLDFYAAALGSMDGDRAEKTDAVLVEICSALASYPSANGEARSRAQRILLDGLGREKGKGLLGKLRKSSLKHSERVEIAICDALAAIGSSEAVLPLRELEANGDGELAAKAAEAADAILGRDDGDIGDP